MKRDYKLYLNDVKESIKIIESYLQNISEEQFKKDERLPYWAELWPSSIALTKYLSGFRPNIRNAFFIRD